ncbi:MAG: response regulator [Planctomycetaceae bacterium]|jgi:uncharacterized Zn finger protein (UPF0148 family)|nr:response regulator [Planctomycetaceae bacterium]
MSGATYFSQECPTCGRQLQVRLAYLGKTVSCQHCEREFEASPSPQKASDSGEYLLDRAEELLTSVEASRPRPR